MLTCLDLAVKVFSLLFDEYTQWMTRNPLLQPSVGYLWKRYHGLIPAAINRGMPTDDLVQFLVARREKHHRQTENVISSGMTPRTLDIMMVMLCDEALTAFDLKEKHSNFTGRTTAAAPAKRHDPGH
jgi:hypothetical protein